ncbi:MAG: OmpA family protein [Cyclobacteriaceae bacterium]|nr:OmpA family protein [Cyclobacteriaceae bacterium]
MEKITMLSKTNFTKFAFMLFAFLTINLSYGQDADPKKLISKADKYFSIKNYKEAIPLYLQAIDAGANDVLVYYNIAKSYHGSLEINDQVKSISYFEKAIAGGINPIPKNFHSDLGDAYHLDGQVKKAMDAYQKHLKTVDSRDQRSVKVIKRKIEIAENALALVNQPIEVTITKMDDNLNTEYTEYNPVVSSDESVIAFTGIRPNTGKTRPGDKFIENVYVSYNETGNWSIPEKIEINSNYNIGTAGISADGQTMLIFIGAANNSGNLYVIEKDGNEWTNPVSLGNAINSNYLESTASITPDGQTIYLASNRKNGYGGLDIYKATKNTNGTWNKPVNLGPSVNTQYDEDAPFIHPDQKTLFFTSNGHNTMGGNDIFKTELVNNTWTRPLNMRYPINTTANDNYFTLTADGRRGYFSSDRKGSTGSQDIYNFDMPEDAGSIALTMLKGKILDAETNKPMPTKIYIFDSETNEKLDFVYHPNKETGNYLIILPPNKGYDMIIESEGFLPYTLNIDIPNQTYFYQLYQQIYLKTIKQFDVVVGQEVEIKNAFYDTYQENLEDMKKSHEAGLVQNDSIDAYELMNDLIAADDQEGINYLLELIQLATPIETVDFTSLDAEKMQEATRTYFYDESDESKFEQRQVGDETIFSLPTMYVTEEAELQKKEKEEIKNKVTYSKAILEKVVKVYFGSGQSTVDTKYNTQLDEILTILNENDGLGVEISGFASSEGDADANRLLSNERAKNVLSYLNTKGVVRRRIIARGFGVTKEENVSSEESRRVDLKIVVLN